ncbi:hypothetical protein CEXT_60671 [Caerostris extrusa]|uniref:Uncharacterized protein n=1 Tax=Caerostris extrusa TaxID=172846 RepID=A0AAV4P487_CAEEX|nr:hypothetical protein CEXT_60671 [Caerostris extrusa]
MIEKKNENNKWQHVFYKEESITTSSAIKTFSPPQSISHPLSSLTKICTAPPAPLPLMRRDAIIPTKPSDQQKSPETERLAARPTNASGLQGTAPASAFPESQTAKRKEIDRDNP